MSAKVSKAAIGAFVLGAIALLVAGVLVFGSGRLFTTEHIYVTFFDGSVKGLAVGSPVTFRGVKIGEVKSISIIADTLLRRLKIPVVFSIEPAKFRGTRNKFQEDPRTVMAAVKELGLRTQLQSMSFVTGQLMVALDFFPGSKPEFIGLIKEYPEIPSMPTPFEQIQKTLENLPLREIILNLNDVVAETEKLLKSIDARHTMQTADTTLREAQALLKHVDAKVDPLVASLEATLASTRGELKNLSSATQGTLAEAKETLASARGNLDDLVSSTEVTLETAEAALKQSEETLKAYSGDSELMAELSRTLRELSATSRSLKNLTDYLQRYPESVIRGKSKKNSD